MNTVRAALWAMYNLLYCVAHCRTTYRSPPGLSSKGAVQRASQEYIKCDKKDRTNSTCILSNYCIFWYSWRHLLTGCHPLYCLCVEEHRRFDCAKSSTVFGLPGPYLLKFKLPRGLAGEVTEGHIILYIFIAIVDEVTVPCTSSVFFFFFSSNYQKLAMFPGSNSAPKPPKRAAFTAEKQSYPLDQTCDLNYFLVLCITTQGLLIAKVFNHIEC